jgi:general secretion pathway protein A
MKTAEFYKKFGWVDNPFYFSIDPRLSVEQQKYYDTLKLFLDSGDKFALVVGDTGSGKTTLLKKILLENRNALYLAKPPNSEVKFSYHLKKHYINFFSRFFVGNNLSDVINKIATESNKRKILIIDEFHESESEFFSCIRELMDNVNNLSIIAAGLPHIIKLLEEQHPTIYSRLSEIIRLEPLSNEGTLELINLRIKNVNGNGIEPFTLDAINEVHRISQGVPREILRVCGKAVKEAILQNRTVIDANLVRKNVGLTSSKTPVPYALTDKQKKALEIIKTLGYSTPAQISETLLSEYPSRSHALRAVNNLLKRMLELGLVERKRQGRTYVYHTP